MARKLIILSLSISVWVMLILGMVLFTTISLSIIIGVLTSIGNDFFVVVIIGLMFETFTIAIVAFIMGSAAVFQIMKDIIERKFTLKIIE